MPLVYYCQILHRPTQKPDVCSCGNPYCGQLGSPPANGVHASRLIDTRAGIGSAFRQAMSDERWITNVQWYTKPLEGFAGMIGGLHSFLVVTQGQGIDADQYIIEKAALPQGCSEDEEECRCGLFVSHWKDVKDQFQQPDRGLSQEQITSGISMWHLWDHAVREGPYDVGKNNCHHASYFMYNFCAKDKYKVDSIPNYSLTAVVNAVQHLGMDLPTRTQSQHKRWWCSEFMQQQQLQRQLQTPCSKWESSKSVTCDVPSGSKTTSVEKVGISSAAALSSASSESASNVLQASTAASKPVSRVVATATAAASKQIAIEVGGTDRESQEETASDDIEEDEHDHEGISDNVEDDRPENEGISGTVENIVSIILGEHCANVVGIVAEQMPLIKQVVKAAKGIYDLYETRRNVQSEIARLLKDLQFLHETAVDASDPKIQALTVRALVETRDRLDALGTRLINPKQAEETVRSIKEDLNSSLIRVILSAVTKGSNCANTGASLTDGLAGKGIRSQCKRNTSYRKCCVIS